MEDALRKLTNEEIESRLDEEEADAITEDFIKESDE